MSVFNNKVLLLIGGTRLIYEAVVRHFLEQGMELVVPTVVMKRG